MARVGEDEFCFLLHQIDGEQTVEPFIHQVLQSFVSSFEVGSCEIFMTACIGIALGDSTYQQAEAPLQDADTAMYKAKQRGKNSYQVFDRQMSVATLERLTLETDLRHALNHQEFVPYYQPIVHLHTEALYGVEGWGDCVISNTIATMRSPYSATRLLSRVVPERKQHEWTWWPK